jgi:hypothetical protein
MTLLFAHHVELYHVPVLIVLFAAGALIGWQGIARMVKKP